MKGTVFKTNSSCGQTRWRYQLDAGTDDDGNRVRISKSGFRRKADADAALAKALNEFASGQLLRPDPRTFGEYLDEWLDEHAAQHCSPKTVERYRQLARYVNPQLRRTELVKTSALMLERFYNRLRESGGKNGKPLSAKTVRHVAGVVSAAFNTAVRWKLIPSNPAAACRLPKVERREAKVLDPSELEWMLTAARGSEVYPLLVLAIATGCRRGELLALKWSDVDLFSGQLSISKSLEQTKQGVRVKTPKSGRARKFPLPASALDALREHRSTQERHRQLYGSDYQADLDLIFASPEGDFLKPDSMTAKVCALAKQCGLKGVSLHSFRHTHGSQLLSANVPLPTVSKRLGHASVHITAQVYSHSFSQDEIAAASAWEQAIGGAIRATEKPQ